MSLGASFTQAVALSNTVFQGGRLTVAAGVEGAAVAGTTLAVTTAAKALGGLGAVIGVADAIYSWSTKNPNRKSAEDLLPNLEKNLESLKDAKERLSQIRNMKEWDSRNLVLCLTRLTVCVWNKSVLVQLKAIPWTFFLGKTDFCFPFEANILWGIVLN